jgi:hypothetical protein
VHACTDKYLAVALSSLWLLLLLLLVLLLLLHPLQHLLV